MPNDEEMKTALRDALKQNNLSLVRIAIEKLKGVKTARQVKTILSNPGEIFLIDTPLTWISTQAPSIAQPREQIIKELIDAGADPNVPNKDDVTPLISAARWLMIDYVEALLEKGAVPTAAEAQYVEDLEKELSHKHPELKEIDELINRRTAVPTAEPAPSLQSEQQLGAVFATDVAEKDDDDSSSDDDDDDDRQSGRGKKHKARSQKKITKICIKNEAP